MAKIQEMTQLSPTMEEGTIVKWLKKEGDSVSPGDIIAEVETDKAVMEMEAFETGVILKILHTEGAKLKVGQALAVIGKPGEDVSTLLAGIPQKNASAPSQTKVDTPQANKAETQTTKPSVSEPTATAGQPTETKTSMNSVTGLVGVTGVTGVNLTNRGGLRVLASPLAKSIAIEQGIDLHTVIGTGPEGRITKKDVLDTLNKGSGVSHFASKTITRADEVVTLNGMRKTIAKRLTESKQNLPHFYLNVDVNAKAMESFRLELSEFQKHLDEELQVKVSLNDIIVKATAAALKLHPKVNASFQGDSILQFGRVDVGIAVSLDGGLLTPVIRNADGKSILEISREVKELAKRARERKLKPEEFSNGTFTISNLGMYGISRFTAIINEPESGILAVGSVEDKPVVENGAVVAGRVLSLTLSCDHRVIDGAVGAEFLRTLKSLLEQPNLLAAVI
ncbi:pyruvate dehydrogenase complex dihydrolipoamide acetyltransferase [Leptospira sp. 2 VSF19]|uniref:Acetyltransferase component of pyruvate dehydrogenase complex n=1 Tax=Leptospira soteropolitanensis TaxID=2950025 RepID=A0AAW5VF30_9LEPT|nr:pyruvate dehydrogenase complex dihydrolipoamide acetyltransferase [Leptospira soteropolitanensis]MCW7492327.1 pyruvate dehydrogenase complex dihydrolipoamide acetyltransferase [Leptospira soteropolitanensis]MCW7499909.1 pyruvate dehydrogenase complex dihydrolipoamide acetyltransferase [Leptospira soteropolitanensis]MCW7522160.1 pyruvate dehydrogenase complex dihydrolipoamide acetyltransferase [Leptospira soteropolitanensis]MCW7526014.1 pyruvate dehydrogenase complex dihydrolipoamide acetyltr